MRRKLTVLLTVLALTFPLAAPVSANSNCDVAVVDPATRSPDDTTYRYAGWSETSSVPQNAIGAYLEYLTPGVNDWNGLSAHYVELAYVNGADNKNWIQAGYISRNVGGFIFNNIYVEEMDGGVQRPIQWYNAPAVDSVNDFQIGIDPIGNYNVWLNSVPLGGAADWVSWLPNRARVMGETKSRGVQLFGGTWDYADVTAMRYQVNWNGTYINFGSSPSTTFQPINTFDSAGDGGDNFEAWYYQPNQQTYNGSSQMDIFDWDCH